MKIANKLLEIKAKIDSDLDNLIKGISPISEYEQNTINDFYENDVEMFSSLVDLFITKIKDNMKEGETYDYSRMLEIIGFANGYVLTFIKGKTFKESINEREKVPMVINGNIYKKRWLFTTFVLIIMYLP
jgi:hypothetical protein